MTFCIKLYYMKNQLLIKNILYYKRKLFVIFVVIILILLISFYSCSNPVIINGEPAKRIDTYPLKEWTFIIYLDGSNNLEYNAIEDFNELEYGLYLAEQIDKNIENKINIVVLFDRIDGYYDAPTNENGNNWTNTRIYKVNPDKRDPGIDSSSIYFTSDWIITGINDPAKWDANMGDPQTLSWFINYSKTYFPANHYALILWDHGGGARSVINNGEILTSKAISWDEESTDSSNSDDALYLDELQQALSNNFSSTNKLDVIGMDACLMAEVEVAYEFRNLAKYFVASMAEEPGDGWNYSDIFEKLVSSDYNFFSQNDQAKTLATLLVDSYHDSYLNYSNQTLSAVDLLKVVELKTELDKLAQGLYNLYSSSQDKTQFLNDFKNNILESNSTNFSEGDYINLPYYDIYSLINNIKTNYNSLSVQCDNVIQVLSDSILKSYAGSTYGDYYDIGSITKRGLSIFFSFDSNDYSYQWWYTSNDTASIYGKIYLYGNIDFCNFDNDTIVETWKELMEAWYDPDNKITTDTY